MFMMTGQPRFNLNLYYLGHECLIFGIKCICLAFLMGMLFWPMNNPALILTYRYRALLHEFWQVVHLFGTLIGMSLMVTWPLLCNLASNKYCWSISYSWFIIVSELEAASFLCWQQTQIANCSWSGSSKLKSGAAASTWIGVECNNNTKSFTQNL